MGATRCSANVAANGQKKQRTNETKGKTTATTTTTKQAGKKSNNCQELGHITALVDARQWGRRDSFPAPSVVSYYYSYCCLPPPSPLLPPLLHLCVSCSGHSVSMSCLPAVCVFRMFLALLNALLFDQSPDCPAVGRSDCPTDRLATRQVVQLAVGLSVGLSVGLIDCPA